jgi:hypothetical protein
LPIPWGNCTNDEIGFFRSGNYTQAKCELDHETEELVSICGCKKMEMPGEMVSN